MKLDSTAASPNKRIAGTLHMRGYLQPVLARDESVPKKKTAESEDQQKNSGQNNHNGAR